MLNQHTPKKRTRNLELLFWSHVEKTDSCWLWTGEITGKGYGRLNTRIKGRHFHPLAHRFSYELHKGPIPDDLLIRHTCDVRNCVNPNHLIPGTNAENQQDKVDRDRAAKGEKNGWSVLTEDQVRAIHRLYSLGGTTHRRLGAQFGVSGATISHILSGRNWSHLHPSNNQALR